MSKSDIHFNYRVIYAVCLVNSVAIDFVLNMTTNIILNNSQGSNYSIRQHATFIEVIMVMSIVEVGSSFVSDVSTHNTVNISHLIK